MAKARAAPSIKIPKRATPADQIPRRVVQPTIDDHLEIMTRAIFQAGLSWAIIAARWPAFQSAFDRFDTARVAAYGESDVERIMSAAGLIHSEKKIKATIANARALIAVEREFGSVAGYLATFANYRARLGDARKRFAFLGDLSCYYWLFRTGNRVPRFEDWIADQATDHPRMREMVMLGRAESTSSEDDSGEA